MASPKLIITFSGLCAYAPSNVDITGATKLDALDVLLVNAVEDRKEDLLFPTENLNTHYPLFVFNLQNLEELSSLDVGPAQGVWRFNSHELYIGNGSVDGVYVRRTGASGEKPQNTGHENDFFWVPELRDVLKGAGDITKDLVKPAKEENRIAGCVHLQTGTIASKSVSILNGDYVVSQFVPQQYGKPGLRKTLADEVSLEVDNVTRITAEFVGFGEDRGTAKKITLVPRGGKNIEISIINLCGADVFSFIQEKDVAKDADAPRSDFDFQWFYLLTDIVKEEVWPPYPTPVEFNIDKGDGGGQPAICTGATTRPPRDTTLQGPSKDSEDTTGMRYETTKVKPARQDTARTSNGPTTTNQMQNEVGE